MKKIIDDYLICISLKFKKIKENVIEINGKTFDSYDKLFDYFERNLTPKIKEYEEIFKNYSIDSWKFKSGMDK